MISQLLSSVTQAALVIANGQWAVLITLVLVGLLVLRELMNSMKGRFARRVVDTVTISLIPLLVFFFAIVIARFSAFLS